MKNKFTYDYNTNHYAGLYTPVVTRGDATQNKKGNPDYHRDIPSQTRQDSLTSNLYICQ